jgi:outer membrane protein OmpA-like peptidoglycan-associated protein
MMNTNFKRTLAISAAALLTACASTPEHNPLLDDARSLYQRATSDPQVARSGAIELQKARSALVRAEAALEENETNAVEHYAYLAKRRTEAALEAARIAASNEAVRAAQTERQRILIAARTQQAQAQRERAEQSLQQAQAARERAQTAREQAQSAQEQAARQRAEAQQAREAAQAAEARAQQLASELEALHAKKTDRGMVLTLEDVLFDTGSAVLKPGAERILDRVSAFLKQYPERTILVEGHTDAIGSADYNQSLSERRAFAVKHALVARGVESSQITARGLGEDMPAVGNDTAAGRQQNRRVEIVIPNRA